MNIPVVFSYLQAMNEKRASDLYLTVDFFPTLRIEDNLLSIGTKLLTIEDMNDILSALLTSRQRREFEGARELNTALDMGEHGRYRVNVFVQRQNPALVIRRIVTKIPTFEELRLPGVLKNLACEERGMVLITGMTGAGKSTTLASMIDYRNQREEGHIVTIEDPIEYFHRHKKSIVTQREVGVDTESYAVAMKNVLRQRPDLILVGEIRDREVMEQALTSAETGHLCLSTLHTNNSYQAIERIVNLFPEDQHAQIRLNLSLNLKAIISQRLVPGVSGELVLAMEIMLNQGVVKEMIQEGKINKIKDVMEQNQASGMCTFDQSLLRSYQAGLITEETAVLQSDVPGDMKVKLQSIKLGNENSALSQLDTSLLSISE